MESLSESTFEPAVARTALEGPTAPGGLAVTVEEVGLRGMIALRGDLASAALVEALKSIAGGEVPPLRRFTLSGDRGVFWMSPDELLLTAPYAEAGDVVRRLREALAGEHHMAIDISDARQVFRLTGAGAREILAKGAPIDLHPASFGVGDLRRTRIEQVAAAIYQTADAPEQFEIFCFRSYAHYLWSWLTASAKTGAQPRAFGLEGV